MSFKYFGGIMTDIITRTAMAKTALIKRVNYFISKVNNSLRKTLMNNYVWIIALYGAET